MRSFSTPFIHIPVVLPITYNCGLSFFFQPPAYWQHHLLLSCGPNPPLSMSSTAEGTVGAGRTKLPPAIVLYPLQTHTQLCSASVISATIVTAFSALDWVALANHLVFSLDPICFGHILPSGFPWVAVLQFYHILCRMWVSSGWSAQGQG